LENPNRLLITRLQRVEPRTAGSKSKLIRLSSNYGFERRG
jgi:hypothetical protein